jgi:hypothetical protein
MMQRRRYLALAVFGALTLFASQRLVADEIDFSGITWDIKRGNAIGPGPNNWSDSSESVFVDPQGQLHLKVRQIGNEWHSAEVISQQSFGYGTYTFQVATDVEQYANNVVLGMFTYLDDLNEVDIELAQFGNPNAPFGNFVVQPAATSGNVNTFDLNLTSNLSTHRYTWLPDSILFESWQGHGASPSPTTLIHDFSYTGNDIPTASTEKLHLNLWQFQGQAPANGLEHEVIITSANFSAIPEPSSLGILTTVGLFSLCMRGRRKC